jgi:hypothetical protein
MNNEKPKLDLVGEAMLETTMSSHAAGLSPYLRQFGIRHSDSTLTRFVWFLFYLARRNVLEATLCLRVFNRVASILNPGATDLLLSALDACLTRDSRGMTVDYYLVTELCAAVNRSEWAHERFQSVLEGNTTQMDQRDLLAALHLHVERGFMLNMPAKTDKTVALRDTLRRRLASRIATSGPHESPPSASAPQNLNRILFVIGHLQALPNIGSHLRQVAGYTFGIASRYPEKQVSLVVTNELTTAAFDFNLHALPPDWREIVERQFVEINGGALPENLSLRLHSPLDEPASYFQEVADSLLAFKPDVAFMWLGFYAADLFRRLVSTTCPVVSIQFNAGNPPDNDSELILSQGYRSDFSDLPRSMAWRNHSLPLVPPKKWKEVDCSTIRRHGRFVIVTTLGGGRLEQTISRYPTRRINEFVGVFTDHPEVDWIMVGVTNSDLISGSDPRVGELVRQGRLSIHPYFEDLRALYACCDTYVHLPGLGGGGWGIAMAVFERLPVLAESGKDSQNFLPRSSLYDPEEAWQERLSVRIRDPRRRSEQAAEQLTRMDHRHSPEMVGEELLAFGIEARKLRKRRHSQR